MRVYGQGNPILFTQCRSVTAFSPDASADVKDLHMLVATLILLLPLLPLQAFQPD